jgi:tetratricopeptide (TPR) repeat protein
MVRFLGRVTVSVGGWRKSQMRSSNIAWGIVSNAMANKQEMKSATEALSLLDTALNINDNVNDRLCKAYLYKELKQSENALKELNHIIASFPGDPLYISVRQMKTEIEGV